ncbi:MAG: hypothetical protein ACYTG0_00005, partial [Planctomycetota bacterium]
MTDGGTLLAGPIIGLLLLAGCDAQVRPPETSDRGTATPGAAAGPSREVERGREEPPESAAPATGASDVSPESETAKPKRALHAGPAPAASILWDEARQAAEFSFRSPRRNSNAWARAYRRRPLQEIAKRFPGGIDEARARLELAWLGSSNWRGSNRARHHVVSAQRIVTRLIDEAPHTPGLLEAAYKASLDASGLADGSTSYYRVAREFLDSRWRAGGDDAPKAGFLLGEIILSSHLTKLHFQQRVERVEQLARVAERYPESYWGLLGRVETFPRCASKSDLEPYLKFADAHRGHPAAGVALARASSIGGYGTGTRDVDDARERLELAMELQLRFAREHPTGVTLDDAYRARWRYRQTDDSRFGSPGWPSIQLRRRQHCSDPTRVEALCRQYFALRPFASFGRAFRYTLAKAKGIYGDPEAIQKYCVQTWDRIEELASPEKRQEVLAARVHHDLYSGWGPGDLDEARKHAERLMKEYADGSEVPAILDA